MLYLESLALPVVAAMASIIALPPINFALFGFFALIPLYIFIFNARTLRKTIMGVALYYFICAGYTTGVTITGFSWITEAVLFSWFMYLVGVGIVIMAVAFSICWATGVWFAKRQSFGNTWWWRMLLFTSFAGIDALLSFILYGFNYGSFVYVAVELAAILPGSLASAAPGWYVLGVVTVNALLAEAVLTQPWKQNQKLGFLAGVVIAVVLSLFITDEPNLAPSSGNTLSVAIIQDPTTDQDRGFGKITDRQFTFPRLEETLADLSENELDMIIYPFNPWSGVLGESSDDNLMFDRQIITITHQQFSDWLKKHVSTDTLFVTWYTRYANEQFFNEVVYWQNGEIVATYQKANLFPFFDYTPLWAQKIGLYSTPIDATIGQQTAPIKIGNLTIGNAICSEITKADHIADQLEQSDVLLTIGSEAMFSNEIPSTFNATKARLYATKHQKTIIRATRSGPSVVYDANGKLIARAAYGSETNLIFELPVP